MSFEQFETGINTVNKPILPPPYAANAAINGGIKSNVQTNEEGDSSTAKIAGTGAVGVAAGAVTGGKFDKMPLVPKKIKSMQELVNAMNAKDEFKLRLPNNVTDDVQEAKTLIENAAGYVKYWDVPEEEYYKKLLKNDDILQGRESLSLSEYAKEVFGIEIPGGADASEYIATTAKENAICGPIRGLINEGEVLKKANIESYVELLSDRYNISNNEVLTKLKELGIIQDVDNIPEQLIITKDMISACEEKLKYIELDERAKTYFNGAMGPNYRTKEMVYAEELPYKDLRE